MNTDLRKKKKYFKKDFLQLMNNAVFQKTMEHVRKHRDAELSITEKKKVFVSIRAKLSYYKVFQRISVIKKKKKTETITNKPVYLGLSVIELSKILEYEIWYKADVIYKGIAEDIETRCDTSNYELDRLLPKGKNKKVIRLMKDKLGGKIMT